MTTVKFDVFGSYTRGRKAGEVNPKAKVAMTMRSDSVKDCIKKLTKETDGAFYIIKHVSND